MENVDTLFQYWRNQSVEKWKTAESLMSLSRYADALFFCHLALELELKALVTLETKAHPPLIHDLSKLATLTSLPLSTEQLAELDEITTFNIRARYDDYKTAFYKKATKEYAEQYFEKAKNMLLWIDKHLQ